MSGNSGQANLDDVSLRSILSKTNGGNVCIGNVVTTEVVMASQITTSQSKILLPNNINFPTTVSIGPNSSLVFNDNVIIGNASTATGTDAMTIGYTSTASGNYAISIGYTSTADGAKSIAIGTSAYTSAGNQGSIALGRNAYSIGYYSIAIGGSVSNPISTASRSIAIGHNANADNMYAICIGSSTDSGGTSSIAIGETASADGVRCISIGYNSLSSTSTDIIAIGRSSSVTGPCCSIGIGRNPTISTSGSSGIGKNIVCSGQNYTFAVGDSATSYGKYSIVIGKSANAGASAFEGIAIGSGAISSAISSIAIGYDAQSTIQSHIAIGSGSRTTVAASTKGSIAIGYSSETLSDYCVAIGTRATSPSNAYTKADIASVSLGHVCRTYYNESLACGNQVRNNSQDNLCIGTNIDMNATGETNAIAIGTAAYSDTHSVAIGHFAKTTTTGSGFQVAIGYKVTTDIGATYKGGVTIGRDSLNNAIRNSIVIGSDCFVSSSREYCTVLGYDGTVTADNQVTFGSITEIRAGTTSLHTISDKRDKADIESSTLGIEFVKKIRPVTFKWDKREWYENGISDGSKKENKLNLGLIAQEVLQIQKDTNTEFLDIVLDVDPLHLEVAPGKLRLILLKAIQEIDDKNKALENEIDLLTHDALIMKSQLVEFIS